MSALSGVCKYLPAFTVSSHSNQGYLLWLNPASELAITSKDLDLSRTPTIWPGFTVDGQVVNIPSYSVKAGQIVGVRERSKSLEVIANSLAGFNHSKYPWLEWDETVKAGKYLHTPERADIPENIKEHLIVELYSK